MDIASEFNRIFAGNQSAHGEYVIQQQKGSKAVGKAKTIQTPPDEELWSKHLNGELGLGVVPIRKDNTCLWGAVDVDVYDNLDIEEWSNLIPDPLILCRSKSGGAHIYLFANSPVSAKVMRKKLALVARAVGHPSAEIFPKQDLLEAGGTGNWINMPYFQSDSTVRYAIKGGVILTADEFITLVSENAISPTQLASFQIEAIRDMTEDDPEFTDAPPCLQKLVKDGFPTGSRNSALFSMGVFARMKFGGDSWKDKVFEYNNRFMGPGSYTEVAGIIRSLDKKSYVYKCKDQPLLSVCDKEACVLCTYGIQLPKEDEKLRRPCILDQVVAVKMYKPESNSKDEPYWVFDFGGKQMDVTVAMTRSQSIFANTYTSQFYRVILPIKDNKWVAGINALIDPEENPNLEIHELAPDAGPEGQMMIFLEEYCTNKSQAKVKDELILGKPWHDEGRTYFRINDFVKFLDQQRFRDMKSIDIIKTLKSRGAKHHLFVLKGKQVKCWSINEFTVQTEDFDRETIPDEDEY